MPLTDGQACAREMGGTGCSGQRRRRGKGLETYDKMDAFRSGGHRTVGRSGLRRCGPGAGQLRCRQDRRPALRGRLRDLSQINRNVGGPFGGVESFLREHYTASREAAAAITAYLNSVGGSPAAADRKPAKGKRKADDKKKDAKPAKTEEKKEKKPEEKSGDKPAEKPADKKSDKDKKDSGQAAHPKSAAIARAAARG